MSLALNTVVYNEAHRIGGLIAHASVFCDELIVVDQSSTDGTGDLAEELGATVIRDKHWGFCERSRPLAAEHTRSDWILVLDGDETIAFPKHVELLELTKSYFAVGFLNIAAYIDGERTDPIRDGEYRPNFHCRIFRKGAVRYELGPHNRMEPIAGPEWRSSREPWILNSKQMWEHLLDDECYGYPERYAALMEAGR